MNEVDKWADYLLVFDEIVRTRPFPYREYDQIYMRAQSMVRQVEYLAPRIRGKNVAFLGDGDSICLMLALAHAYGLLADTFSSATVFDFDERIIANIENVIHRCSLQESINTSLYNVADPIDESFKGLFDCFYFNPPYGSKNAGQSCLMWLYRCSELCVNKCFGYIAMPGRDEAAWADEAINTLELTAPTLGFEVSDDCSVRHGYHLDDNPDLHSTNLCLKREGSADHPYTGLNFPIEMARKMYGNERDIPHYILLDQSNPCGRLDFDWIYGGERAT